jgi:predicted ester cyclase
MGEHQAVAAVRSAVAALNAGDVAGYLCFFDPSCERWVAGYAQPLTLGDVGDGLRGLCAAFAGLRLDEDLLFGDARFVCARWRMRGVHVGEYLGFAPSGRPIDIETCEVYEISGGVVVTSWVYGDLLEQLIRQIDTASQSGAAQ